MTTTETGYHSLLIQTKPATVVVAVHQPNYLPWFGYFLKMAVSDIFVFHDDVAINSRGLTRRVKIAHQLPFRQPRWLTVPLHKHSDSSRICDLLVCKDQSWAQQHLALIANTYVHSPYFSEVMPMIEAMFLPLQELELLAQVNMHLIRAVDSAFELSPQYEISSQFAFRAAPSETNAALVKALQGTHYLSGKGAEAYEKPESYARHGILHVGTDASAFLQRQLQPYETSNRAGCSVVDLWMHMGTDWMKETIQIWRDQVSKNLR